MSLYGPEILLFTTRNVCSVWKKFNLLSVTISLMKNGVMYSECNIIHSRKKKCFDGKKTYRSSAILFICFVSNFHVFFLVFGRYKKRKLHVYLRGKNENKKNVEKKRYEDKWESTSSVNVHWWNFSFTYYNFTQIILFFIQYDYHIFISFSQNHFENKIRKQLDNYNIIHISLNVFNKG